MTLLQNGLIGFAVTLPLNHLWPLQQLTEEEIVTSFICRDLFDLIMVFNLSIEELNNAFLLYRNL